MKKDWRDTDAPVLYKWASDPDVGPRAGWPPHQSVEESLEVIWTVFHDATNTWAIDGLMIEHVRCATGIKSLISGHFVDNPAKRKPEELHL